MDQPFNTSFREKINEIEENAKLTEFLDGSKRDETDELLLGLRDILNIADQWRKHFEAREGSFDIIGVSIRDTEAITRKFNKCRDVKQAYLSIFDDFRKNPIESLDDLYLELLELLNNVLDANADSQTQ